MYAQQINGIWTELRGNVVFSPNVYQTAESLSDEQRAEFGVYLIVDTPKPPITYKQKYGDPIYTVKGATVERAYSAVDKTQVELDDDTADKAAEIRAERNSKLSACDWTQLPDAPVDSAAWAAYRQELRDISSQAGFPWEVVWPQEP